MYQNQSNFDDHHEQSGSISWVCPRCQTINQGQYCCSCGKKRKNGTIKFNPWKYVSIALIIILVLMLIGFFSGGDASEEAATEPTSAPAASGSPAVSAKPLCAGGHSFVDATCENPKTCKECGVTEGEPLGHAYSPASCTTPARCTRCLKSDGAALSHNWLPATYDSPKRCDRCGETSGNVKGYYETLKGSWKDTRVSVGGCDTTPWVFDNTVKNCVKFTMYFKIEDVDYGKVTGKYTLYTKENGKWKKLSTFNVSDDSAVEKTFEFKDPVDITQLAVVPPYRSSYSYSFSLGFYDWYLHN